LCFDVADVSKEMEFWPAMPYAWARGIGMYLAHASGKQVAYFPVSRSNTARLMLRVPIMTLSFPVGA
jgi:hypothetical protein